MAILSSFVFLIIVICYSSCDGLRVGAKLRSQCGSGFSGVHKPYRYICRYLRCESNMDSWFSSNGGKAPKCSLFHFPNNLRGLIATENIEPEEIFMQVPLHICFRSLPHKGRSWPLCIASQMLNEFSDGAKSKWHDYFLTMPASSDFTSSLPMYWRQEFIENLRSPELEEETQKGILYRGHFDIRSLETSSSSLGRQELPERLEWMLNCVQTRNCKVPIDDSLLSYPNLFKNWSLHQDGINFVVPFFDMMNHDSTINSRFEIKFRHKFTSNVVSGDSYRGNTDDLEPVVAVWYSGHGLKKGQQICLNYGASVKSAAQFLCSYGFVPTTNFQSGEIFDQYSSVKRYSVGDIGDSHLIESMIDINTKKAVDSFDLVLPRQITSPLLMAAFAAQEQAGVQAHGCFAPTVIHVVSKLGLSLSQPHRITAGGIPVSLLSVLRLVVSTDPERVSIIERLQSSTLRSIHDSSPQSSTTVSPLTDAADVDIDVRHGDEMRFDSGFVDGQVGSREPVVPFVSSTNELDVVDVLARILQGELEQLDAAARALQELPTEVGRLLSVSVGQVIVCRASMASRLT